MQTNSVDRARLTSLPSQNPRAESGLLRLSIVGYQTSEEPNLSRGLERLGYTTTYMPSDAHTLAHLADNRFEIDALILDMRGATSIDRDILKALGSDARMADTPVLVLLGSQDDEQARAALDADLLQHMRAPFQLSLLDSTLRALRRKRKRKLQYERPYEDKSVISLVETCKFRFRSPAEGKQLTPLLAAFFPDRQRAALGVAELIANAIEHGNLEIGRALKGKLIRSGGLDQEIYTRLLKPEYADRTVEVIVARKDEGIMLMVTDDGRGFNWKEHLDIDPASANQDHGRGIARARHMAFDKLTYNEAGNQAIALMTATSALDW
jgi:two-component system, cell cycle response regulator